MPTDNPTFSESWYRVADLRPRLRATVRVHRQHFRGQLWHVVQDPANEDFFRLHEAAYRFVGMLDGRRSVADAWRTCTGRLGDEALTQTEVVQILGQLYGANLLQADLPPDAEGLFQRHRKRSRREMTGRLANILFLRIPLFDPDRLLDRLVGVVGLAFTPVGFVLWAILVAAGAWCALSRPAALVSQAEQLLNARQLARNLPLLYAVFILAKLVHEFSHAFACKKFGLQTHTGGEVHAMGIMFLVFAPMPFVDASSTWALRSRLHRAVVAAAGMMAELALAAAAAIVWTSTAGAAESWTRNVHAAAYSLMFIASISTLLFNGNPLMRFDGYYILSDLVGIPNLGERSRRYLAYLVKRHVWSVRDAFDPSQSASEAAWLVGYGIASTLFRVFICVKILLMLAERFFLIGSALAAMAVVTWVLLPLGKFVHYLLASPELARSRARAVAITAASAGALLAAVGLIRAPDRQYVEGVVEPARIAFVHAGTDGFVESVLPPGQPVKGSSAGGARPTIVLSAVNRELEVDLRNLLHEQELLTYRIKDARRRSAADKRYLNLVQVLEKDLADLGRQIEMSQRALAGLSVAAPFDGTWLSRQAEKLPDAYVRQGERIGMVADLENVVFRAAAGQRVAGMLLAEADKDVEVRVVSQPSTRLWGRWRCLPAGHKEPAWKGLSSAQAAPAEPSGADGPGERRFEIHITPSKAVRYDLLPGQAVVARFQMPPKPLILQWWRSFRQLAQQRFGL